MTIEMYTNYFRKGFFMDCEIHYDIRAAILNKKLKQNNGYEYLFTNIMIYNHLIDEFPPDQKSVILDDYVKDNYIYLADMLDNMVYVDSV